MHVKFFIVFLYYFSFFLSFYIFIVQVQLSPFSPTTPPHPSHPTSPPWSYPSLVLSMCPLYMFFIIILMVVGSAVISCFICDTGDLCILTLYLVNLVEAFLCYWFIFKNLLLWFIDFSPFFSYFQFHVILLWPLLCPSFCFIWIFHSYFSSFLR